MLCVEVGMDTVHVRSILEDIVHYCVNARPNHLCGVTAQQNAGWISLQGSASALDGAWCMQMGYPSCADEGARVALVGLLSHLTALVARECNAMEMWVTSDLGFDLSR